MKTNKEMDLTNGSILKKMVIFSIPFIFTNILQILFNSADIAVLGIFSGDSAVAAVGASTNLTGLIVGLFIGLSIGTNVVLARYVGAKDKEGASKTVGTSIIVAFSLGILMLTIGVILAPWFLKMMDCAESVFEDATLYLRIYFLGAPAMLVYNYSASILRSVGDTRRPLIFLAISGAVNVVLNIFKVQLKEILAIGIPSGLQSVAFNIANVIIQKTVNGLGEACMSASTAAQQFDAIVYNVGYAVSMSCMAFIGQNIGAKNIKNVKKTIFCGITLVFLFQATTGFIFFLLAPWLCSLIVSDSLVIQMGASRLKILAGFYFICGIMDVFANANRAMGKPVTSLIISVMGATVFRLAFLKLMMYLVPSFATIYWSYPASWVFTIACYLIMTPITYKKTKIAVESQPQN